MLPITEANAGAQIDGLPAYPIIAVMTPGKGNLAVSKTFRAPEASLKVNKSGHFFCRVRLI